MFLDHFSAEAVSVDIFYTSQPNKFAGRFFADIQDDEATFKDRTDTNCRITLKSTNAGMVILDQCHGTGKIDGLYKRTKVINDG